MDFLDQQFAQGVVHQPLPLDPVRTDEGGRSQLDREMTLAALRVMARMAAMLFAVVDNQQMRRIEREAETGFDFCGDRAFCLRIHDAYIRALPFPG